MDKPRRQFQLRAGSISWTKFGYDDAFEEHVKGLIDTTAIKYITFGYEKCPTTGRKHLQGMAYSKTTQSGNFWSVAFPGCELEKAIDIPALIGYCQKEGLFQEWGTPPPGKGKRTDLALLHTDLKSGMSPQDVSNVHFGELLRYSKGISEWYRLNSCAATRLVPRILWLYGASGTGKSQLCLRILSNKMAEAYFLSSSHTGCWWNNYCGQKIVVMDDLRAGWMEHNQLLRVFDSTPHMVPFKGGMVALEANVFLVSTNDPPHQLYKNDPSKALLRRIQDFAWVIQLMVDGTFNRMSSAKLHSDDDYEEIFGSS